MFAGKHQAAALVVEGNPQRLASVAFSALEGLPRVAQLKQRLRQLRQKTAWSLNFDVNAFDFIGGKDGDTNRPDSDPREPQWRSLLGAKLARNVTRRFTMVGRIRMKYPHSISLWQTNVKHLP